MIHQFDKDIAVMYGVNCAIILNNLYYWTEKNIANGRHFHDGMYWVYNSISAFEELFPYMSSKQIRGALEKLKEEGIIVDGNYNTNTYDHTKWYALTEKGKSICTKGQIEVAKKANRSSQKGKPIPIINTINNPIENNNMSENEENGKSEEEQKPEKKQRKRFVIPSPEEVDAYCLEKGFEYVNPYDFFDFYDSKDWMVGKNKMSNWHSAVSGWNRRSIDRGEKKYYRKPSENKPEQVLINTDRHMRFRDVPDELYEKLKPMILPDGSMDYSYFNPDIFTEDEKRWMAKNDM